MKMKRKAIAGLCATLLFAGACGDDPAENGNNGTNNGVNNGTNNGVNNGTNNGVNNGANNGANNGTDVEVPTTYSFESRFEEGASSVSYTGQIFRHVLISDLNTYIGGLSDDIDSAVFTPTAQDEVVSALNFYFRFDSEADGDAELLLETDPPTLQTTYNDISSGKDIVGKLAGNDTVTDHRDWSTEFSGWTDTAIAANGGSVDTPEGLVTAFFETIEENAIGRANGDVRMGPDGQQLTVYQTAEGHDLKQLTQKFLLGAVAFSQGTDDYLDDDVDGKGLLSANERDDDAPYSTLEHQWDEAYGYFGAARDFLEYTDEEIAGKGGREGWSSGYHDTDGDGAIDLTAEYNFGNSVNAGKRDLGASAATDFTDQAMTAFLTGRAIISSTEGALSDERLSMVQEQRDAAVLAWEKAVAATVVHYINDTLQAMGTFDTAEYSFADHAKVWGEMKGFALGFQFNPRSPVTETQFTELHTLMGDAPVLPGAEQADIDQYKADLLAARAILGDAYGFADANLGDDNGENGW